MGDYMHTELNVDSVEGCLVESVEGCLVESVPDVGVREWTLRGSRDEISKFIGS